jgi:asparagine synthase (glutamine-hydrolysing)
VNRRFAGSLDRGGRENAARLAAAFSPESSGLFGCPPLRVAYSGPPPASTAPLCLLDGHIDNAEEIRGELAADARATDSDEALLGAGYRRWGLDLPAWLRGDFALLLWDGERKEGLLARDQLGVRPLFLRETGGTLFFAGEIRDLLALLPCRPAPDSASIAHWLGLSSRPGAETLYRGICRLGPGEVLPLGESAARPRRYWSPRFCGVEDLPPEQLAAQVRVALERSVRRRLDAEAPIGVLMSGGLDSASVAALCSDVGTGEVHAYSATFPEHPSTDESALIVELRQALGLGGVTAEVGAGGMLASAIEHLAAWQVPVVSWGEGWALPLMRAARAAGVRTMLGGDGGDELFGPRAYLLADRIRGGHPLQALAIARRLPGAGPHVPRCEVARAFGSLALAGALPYRVHSVLRARLTRRQAPAWLLPGTVAELIESDDKLAWKRLDGPLWWARAAHDVAWGIEAGGVFEQQRHRASQAGVEIRNPMLDLDLVELALRQPPLATLDPRFDRPVLRAAMAGLLPDPSRLRPQKAWFESWVVDSLAEADGAAVRQILTDPRAEVRAYLDRDEMERALFGGGLRQAEPFRWMWQVWRLLTMELWLRAQSSPVFATGLRVPVSPARVEIRDEPGSYLFPS